MGHFKHTCECGVIISQCRCIGPKIETIISPCAHRTAETEEKLDELLNINFDNMFAAFSEYSKDRPPSVARVSESTYINLVRNTKKLVRYESDEEPEFAPNWTLFGMKVEVDPRMKPGTWEFK